MVPTTLKVHCTVENAVPMLLMAFSMPAAVSRTAIARFLKICADLSALPRTDAYCTPEVFGKLDWEVSSIGCSANAECFEAVYDPMGGFYASKA